ncbi:MAG TPA: methyltransferase [Acidimicrobiales bacterium]|nr:methyltransferase [Acidimicrobiales bacterium]
MAGTSQYFEPDPDVASRPRTVDLVLPDMTLHLRTDRGVFSAANVDPGTKLLLLEGASPPVGTRDLLDLGCGYGPIALALARRAPEATVWAVDVNRRALALCAANADANGLKNVRTVEPDDIPDDVRFAGIWSNPPIRIGKTALHELLLRWLARLDAGAHAWLVVQKHLGSDSLAKWLTEQGWDATRRVSRSGYRLLEVGRP